MKIFKEKNQENWCEFSKEGFALPKLQWRRIAKGGHRFYFSKYNEKIITALGITSVFDLTFGESKFLRNWKDDNPNWKKDLEKMADYGTLCHIGLSQLYTEGKINQDLIKIADEYFDKKEQFKRDMLSIKKFFKDYDVEVLFFEGILGKEYQNPRGESAYVCSAIDMFCKLKYTEKERITVEDGVYVRGDKKGETKYKDITKETEKTFYAIIDLKSNFNEKESKSFYQGHKIQLLFGRRLISEEFGINKDEIKMFNLSPLGWKTEPKYELKEHTLTMNNYGYTDEDLLDNRINTALIEGILKPNGSLMSISDEITMDSENDFRVMSYEEYANEIFDF